MISAPDKNFTFDKPRDLTPWDHLIDEFQAGVTHVTDDHYLDFISAVSPELLDRPADALQAHVDSVRRRREHVHVWNSESFADFLSRALAVHCIRAVPLFQSLGPENGIEYYGVWQKEPPPVQRDPWYRRWFGKGK